MKPEPERLPTDTRGLVFCERETVNFQDSGKNLSCLPRGVLCSRSRVLSPRNASLKSYWGFSEKTDRAYRAGKRGRPD